MIESIWLYRLHCTYPMQHIWKFAFAWNAPCDVCHPRWFFWENCSPILKKGNFQLGKFAENLPRIIVCICMYLDPSCFDCCTNFERWHPKMAGCFHNNIFEGPKVLGEEIQKQLSVKPQLPKHLSMLPSTNMSLCCMSNIHLLFQLSYMLIWDKVNNHCKGSNASQTHMLEKHHHWGLPVGNFGLTLCQLIGWNTQPTPKNVYQSRLSSQFLWKYTHKFDTTKVEKDLAPH